MRSRLSSILDILGQLTDGDAQSDRARQEMAASAYANMLDLLKVVEEFEEGFETSKQKVLQ